MHISYTVVICSFIIILTSIASYHVTVTDSKYLLGSDPVTRNQPKIDPHCIQCIITVYMWPTSQLVITVSTKVVIYSYTCKFPFLNRYSTNGGCYSYSQQFIINEGKESIQLQLSGQMHYVK